MSERKFRVRGYITTEAWVTVSAEDRTEALEKAKNGGWRSGIGVEIGESDKGSYTALCVDDEASFKGKRAPLTAYACEFNDTPWKKDT